MNTLNFIDGVEDYRRENLRYLVDYQFHSQSNLAWKLELYGLSQPTISDILRSKRHLYNYEAREIEHKLDLPEKWMDYDQLIKDAWKIIELYRVADNENRDVLIGAVKKIIDKKRYKIS